MPIRFGKEWTIVKEGNCDDSVREVCRLLGWEEELHKANASTRVGYKWGRDGNGDDDGGGKDGQDGGG